MGVIDDGGRVAEPIAAVETAATGLVDPFDTSDSPPSWGASGFPDARAAAQLVRPPCSPIAGHVSFSLTPLCRVLGTPGRRESQINGAGGRGWSTPRRATAISRTFVS